jgi:cation:H+ antiporter
MELSSATLLNAGVLLVALVVILGAAELFTNGVEWLGQKLGLSEGVVGSVLAAVGTALPETLIPIVAVCASATQLDTQLQHTAAQAVEMRHDVGIGAIAGAPFMLCTLTMAVCGTAILIFSRNGRRKKELNISRAVLIRDLTFFIGAYVFALLGTLATGLPVIRQIMAGMLMVVYAIYLKKTFDHEGEAGEAPEHLHFERLLKLGTSFGVIVIQVLAGLVGILAGAYFFVEHISALSSKIGVPGVVLAMIIAPVATELPEKFNSVLWARNGKDTLALGNITGALVFQSCFPVAFGLAFTKWNLGPGTVVSGIVAISFAMMYLSLLRANKLKYNHLMLGVIGYVSVISWLMITHLTD